MFAKINLFVVVILCTPVISYSAPTNLYHNAGVFAHNSSATITLAGGGTRASGNAAPIRYDDFESGTTVGHLLTDDLTWWSREPNKTASISNLYNRSNSTKNGEFELWSSDQGQQQGLIYRQDVGFSTTGKVYVNYWTRFDWGTGEGVSDPLAGGVDWQLKTCTINFDIDNLNNETPQISLFNWKYAGGYTRSYWASYWYPSGSGGAGSVYLTANSTTRDLLNTVGWYNVSLQVDMGDPGTANGNIKTWVSPVESNPAYTYGVASSSNIMVLGSASNTDRYIDDIRFGWYMGNTTSGYTALYYDNIYIDNSWARVEIGDASTYDACTHREIQIPTSWADDEITFRVNQGSLAALDGEGNPITYYLYVTDESGVQNTTGLPIQFGASGTADTTPPTVTALTIPSTSTSRTVPISSFTATDDIAVTGYLLTETASTPSAANPNWSASAPTSYTFGGAGAQTIYGWAKDAASNISTSLNDSVTITLPSQSISIGAGSQSITKGGGTMTIIRQ